MSYLPDFYEPSNVGKFYRPDVAQIAQTAGSLDAKPASEDAGRLLLLLVDPQVDFVHEDGTLSVPGAVEDTKRTVEWMYANLERVTDVAVSLDSHYPMQIFYPGWWENENGEHPEPMTVIDAESVEKGEWQPAIKPEWSKYYVRALETRAKKTLMIWPYHVMLGTMGHTITPALYEAMAFHAEARSSQPMHVIKGLIDKTEYYSLFEPEVKAPDEPGGTLNTALLDRLAMTYDLIYVAGQAKSHCVLESLTSMANYTGFQPDLMRKVHLLEDCTSPVAHPDIDFEAVANEQLAELEEKGLKRVKTSDPIPA